MTANYTNWETEFVDAKFVDHRLKKRFLKIMDAFATASDKSTWGQPDPEVLQRQRIASLVIQMYPKMSC